MSQALLLAEAEPGTREFLERHLASDGFAVLGADAGREALELVERERPDLVLVGGLPDAPALEVCVLREGEPGRLVKTRIGYVASFRSSSHSLAASATGRPCTVTRLVARSIASGPAASRSPNPGCVRRITAWIRATSSS